MSASAQLLVPREQRPRCPLGPHVARVANRCLVATENCELDLSECKLAKIPEAIFFLMRHTSLTSLSIADNALRSLPVKVATRFSHLEMLNITHNKLTSLPEEFSNLVHLKRLNISHNNFLNLPAAVHRMSRIIEVNAQSNQIAELNLIRLKGLPHLKEIDIRENPVRPAAREAIVYGDLKFAVKLSDVDDSDEYEDMDWLRTNVPNYCLTCSPLCYFHLMICPVYCLHDLPAYLEFYLALCLPIIPFVILAHHFIIVVSLIRFRLFKEIS